MSRRKVEMPRASFQQINFSCRRLFNLKPYGGIKNGIVHFQSIKISGIFVASKKQRKQEQFTLNSSKRDTKLRYATKVFLFKMRNLPSAHKARLLRTRNAGGVCSSVAYVMSGAPSILIVCYIKYLNLS